MGTTIIQCVIINNCKHIINNYTMQHNSVLTVVMQSLKMRQRIIFEFSQNREMYGQQEKHEIKTEIWSFSFCLTWSTLLEPSNPIFLLDDGLYFSYPALFTSHITHRRATSSHQKSALTARVSQLLGDPSRKNEHFFQQETNQSCVKHEHHCC